MLETKGYAAMTAKAALTPFSFERREDLLGRWSGVCLQYDSPPWPRCQGP